MTSAVQKIREGSGPTLYRQKSGVPGADGSRDLELVQWTDNTGRGAVVTLTGYVGNRWECLGLFLDAAQCRELARALLDAAGEAAADDPGYRRGLATAACKCETAAVELSDAAERADAREEWDRAEDLRGRERTLLAIAAGLREEL